jgi:hypothetical protein
MSDYSMEWKVYLARKRKLVRLLLAELLAFFPSLFLIAFLERRPSSSTSLMRLAIYAWAAIWVITAFRLRFFPCPRCAKNFFGGFFFDVGMLLKSPTAFFGLKCAHCGLRKFANP